MNCAIQFKRSQESPLARGVLLHFALILVCCVHGLAGANHQDPLWKAGTAVASITPDQGLWMAGYGARTKPAEGKETDLWLKALALEDARGHRGLIITSDLIGFPREIAGRVLTNLHSAYGLKPEQVILSSSHTHCGPVLRESAMEIYGLDESQRAKLEKYASRLEAAVVEIAGQALDRLTPASISATQGTTRFAVNRRNNLEKDVPALLASGKAQGPVDHSVPILAIYETNGTLKTVLFGYACHNTTMDYYNWSGDYAGFAQLAIERQHPGATAMFFMGCGGDQNPLPRRKLALAERYGSMLAAAVEEALLRAHAPLEPRLATSMRIIPLRFGQQPGKEELEKIASGRDTPPTTQRWAARLLKIMGSGQALPKSYPYPMQAWRLGERQILLTMGGEPVVDYSLRFKRQFGMEFWIAGYCNDVMGYIPSTRVLLEDAMHNPRPGWGYEGARAMLSYGLPAYRWADDIEELIAATASELVSEATAR